MYEVMVALEDENETNTKSISNTERFTKKIVSIDPKKIKSLQLLFMILKKKF